MNVNYNEQSTIPDYNMNSIYSGVTNPKHFSIVLLLVIIGIYVVIFSLFGGQNQIQVNPVILLTHNQVAVVYL